MGFRLVYKLSYLDEKKFLSIFSIRGDPYQKKVKNFFFLVEWKLIKFEYRTKHVFIEKITC